MALVRLKRSKDEEPLSGQEVLDMRQEIRDQNDQYRAARQAVTDHYANGGTPYDLPDSTALASQKAVIGGHVGQPKYVTDPNNPDNWERWSDEYKRLTGQIVDDTPPLTQSLEAATGNIPKPPRPTDEMYMDALNSKPLVDADHSTPAEEPAQEKQAAGIRYGAGGYPETGGQYDLSQYTPEQIDAAKNTLIRAWNARNPVQSTVIDMNKGSVWTNASDPRDVWADALMGVPYEGAKKNADGTYGIPSTAGGQPSAEWAAEFLRNGGVIGEYGNQTPYGGGTPGSSSTNVTNNYYGNGGTGASPYSEGGGAQGTSYGPVTAWNGEGRPNFSWELNADPLYQMYREMYLKNGRQASDDAMARAAALTGGYGNSYAQAVGTQAYQQWADKLNDVALKLYDTAYSRYRDDMGDYWKQYGYDYQRERDAINDARYEDETAYNRGRDAIGDERWERQWQYGVEQDALNRQRQDWLDQMTANDYYQGEVDKDTSRAAAAMSLANNLSAAGYSQGEIDSIIRGIYGNSVDDAALGMFSGAASSAQQARTEQEQLAQAMKAAAGQGTSGSTTKSQTMSATQRTQFDKECREYAASGDYDALANTINDYIRMGYMTYEEGNQKYQYYANLPQGKASEPSDYTGFFKEYSSIKSASGSVPLESTVRRLAEKYNIDPNEAFGLLSSDYTSNETDVYEPSDILSNEDMANAFANEKNLGSMNFEQEYMATGQVNYGGRTYDTLDDAYAAINADLDEWIRSGRMDNGTANYIRHEHGIPPVAVTPSGKQTSYSPNTQTQTQSGSSQSDSDAGNKFAANMKASDAKTVEDKLKAATSQNDAGRILASYMHLLNEREYNRLWDLYVEKFYESHGLHREGRQ